ncbi:WD40-repeat-containing domain protein [Lentinula raphanica]|uniref:WD40-repeat-containing domain protein n=1 Tax=Lentinula raphanica TaxID=153919 RepID=A0AA38UDI5_9AGAR|nr:WD40-repeat-containing domain protein [Lentinula raphanica]
MTDTLTLISSISFIKRGVARRNPEKYVLDDRELERVSALARIELEDAQVELRRAHEAAKRMGRSDGDGDGEDEDGDGEGEEEEEVEVLGGDEDGEDEDAMDVDSEPPKTKQASKTATQNDDDDDDLSKYNLDEYDNDEGEDNILGHFSNINNIAVYKNNDEDPYITLKDSDADSSDERIELEILPTDNLLVIAKTQDSISQLEVYVYEESEANLYVHHDLMLPNFPLCLEWLDFPPSSSSSSSNDPSTTNSGFGNYIAVGTLDPEIEIWSLDVVESMYPSTILGRPDKSKAHIPVPLGTGKKKRKKTKKREVERAYHVDAVLDLSWNRKMRNLLASASADCTVKLWDLSRDPTNSNEAEGGGNGGALRSFEIHTDKVQAVQWNESDPAVLLTGSYDRTVRTFDSRAPEGGVGVFGLGSDVEGVRWDPWNESAFYVSLENGLVLNYDARTLSSSPSSSPQKPTPARFTLQAHDGAASALDVSRHIKGCIVTGGSDKMVKMWNIEEAEGVNEKNHLNVSLVQSRDLGVGKVFSTAFSPDTPLTIAAGGSKGKLQIWDVGSNASARKALGRKLRVGGFGEEKGKGGRDVIGLVSDGEESEDGNDDDE